MAERNYWAVGATRGGTKDVTQEFIDEKKWFDGYAARDDDRNKNILEQINIGDVLLMKSSATKGTNHDMTFTRLKAIGKILGKEDYSFKVEWFNKDLPKDFDGISYRKTIEIMRDDAMFQFAKETIKNIEMETHIQHKVDLLKSSKNLILTGAPGVGKTYMTAEIAVAVCDGTDKVPRNRLDLMKRYKELVENEQASFTTFHQSLDYEEFIEGLKPKITDDGQVTYQANDGILKNISYRAKRNSEDSLKTSDELHNEINVHNFVELFLDNAFENNTEFETPRNKIKYQIVDLKDNVIQIKNGNFNSRNYEPKRQYLNINKEELIKLLTKSEQFTNKQDAAKYLLREVKHPRDNYLFSVYSELYDSYHTQNKNIINSQNIEKIERKNYVLIIDEINRGNISKIFGELITLLEKDKRLGSENEITVTLPYTQEKFGIPSNLYIIGTMNTADRSIGQIDYALRRRFAFVSLKSDKMVIENHEKYTGNTKKIATDLFENIQTFISANINEDLDAEDLMIGHSYFLCETEEQLKQRLEYEIIPLIKEYEKDGIIMVDKQELNKKIKEWKTL
jgi:5-methylcytosine-specific restriction protein B